MTSKRILALLLAVMLIINTIPPAYASDSWGSADEPVEATVSEPEELPEKETEPAAAEQTVEELPEQREAAEPAAQSVGPILGTDSTGITWTYTLSGTKATLTGFDTAPSGDLVIPSEVDGYTVVGLKNSLFKNNTGITSVVIPESVTTIGTSAFEGCTGLTSIQVQGPAAIGSEAFSGCTALTTADLGEQTVSVGSRAFYKCTKLTKVIIPGTVTAMVTSGNSFYAFEGCTSLISAGPIGGDYNIEFGWTTSIPASAFRKLTSLKTVTLPDTLKTINSYAFDGCTGLTTINFSDGLTEIGNYAFEGCTSLTTINFPEGLTEIGSYAFYGCTSLTGITFPQTLTDIESRAFYHCTSLRELVFPESVTAIGISTFEDCTALTSIQIQGPAAIGGSAFSGCTALTTADLGEQTVSVASRAFSKCTKLTKVIIPGTVTAMVTSGSSYYAFEGCTSLISAGPIGGDYNIEFGWTTSIPSYTFRELTSLKTVALPDTLTTINSYTFYGCTSLTTINFPEGLTEIGVYAFYGCTSLTGITFPQTLTDIESRAFYHCTSLRELVFPESVTTIGISTFEDCTALTSIQIQGPAAIGGSAFSGCTALTTADLGEQTVSVASRAFSKCTKLTKVIIPGTVTAMVTSGSSYYAFEGCTSLVTAGPIGGDYNIEFGWTTSIPSYTFRELTSLKTVTLPDTLTTINSYTFYGCTSLTTINFPEGLTEIGGYAFYGCTSLTGITFPQTLTDIESRAFYHCTSLRELVFPESVTTIGTSAFEGCTALTSIQIQGPAAIGSEAFSGCTALTTADLGEQTVSVGSRAFYKCTKLTKVIIPGTVTAMVTSGNSFYAFEGCTSLISAGPIGGDYNIEFGWTTSIPASAFRKLTSLKTVTLPDTLKTINSYAFEDCTGLTTINFPESLTKINTRAFYGCTSLTRITFPQTLTNIESYAFYECTSLRELVFPESVTTIGDSSFYGCTGLTSIQVQGPAAISHAAFSGCTALTTADLGEQTVKVGAGAFHNCTKLTKVIIPGTVTSTTSSNYSSGPFGGCTRLVTAGPIGGDYNIEFGWTKTIPSRAFNGIPNLAAVTLPDTLQTIDTYAFCECTGLTRLVVRSENVVTKNSSFSKCTALTRFVWFGGEDSTLAANVLSNCSALKEVYFNCADSVPSISNQSFSGVTATVYYPEGHEDVWTESVRQNYGGTLTWVGYTFAIDTQPTDQYVTEGYEVNYSVEVTGNDLHYTWQRSDDNGATWQTVGDDTASLTFTAEAKYHGTLYRCIIDDASARTLVTDTVRLDVFAITVHPTDSYQTTGDPASFHAEAIGLGVTYQWQVNDGSGWVDLDNTTADCILTADPSVHEYSYRCVVTDKRGEQLITRAASLTVFAVTADPVDQDLMADESAQFSVDYIGLGVSCQWQVSSDNGKTWTNLSGQTGASMTALCSWKLNGNLYRCRITDQRGVVLYTDAAKLTVFDIAVQPGSVNVTDGDATGFTVTATGEGLHYQWQVNTGSGWQNVGNDAAVLELTAGAVMDGYVYRCVLTDHLNRRIISQEITLAVFAITKHPSNISVLSRETVTFAAASNRDNVTYNWQVSTDGKTWTNTGCTSATLTVTTRLALSGNLYRCQITNSLNQILTTNSALLTVNPITGTCGTSLTWGLDDDGTLTVQGEGDMFGWTDPSGTPWHAYRSVIEKLSVESGVTSIGANAFGGCTAMTAVDVPETITSIGSGAFAGCTGLTTIEFTGNAPTFDSDAFHGSTLTIIFPAGNLTWTDDVMQDYGGTITWKHNGHRYMPVVTAPTCTDRGYTTYTCHFCDASYIADYVPALGHSYESAVKEPTCTEQGYAVHTCSVCGNSYTDSYIDALGHAYGDWYIIVAPTCTEAGQEQHDCTRCGHTETRSIEASGHSYESVTIEPTCTEQGYSVYTCSVCGNSYTDSYIDALGHAYGDWYITVAPTCTEAGQEQHDCTRCGHAETRSIEASGHSYESVTMEPTCTEQGYTTYTCSICGNNYVGSYTDALGHSYDDNGVCVRCGDTQRFEVASGWSGYLTWSLSNNGVLTFSGEGAMKNYTYKSEMPWYPYFDQITSVVIEEGATSIGSCAFYGMPKLTSITIASTVTSIGDYAFKSCEKLDGVILPANLSKLGDSAFYGCSSLTSIEIPAKLYTIKPYTFKNCTALEAVKFHEGNLQKISDGAFYNTALTELVLPDCLDILDIYTFKNCSRLASITLGSGLSELREAVFYGTAISTIVIPEGITKIGPYAFKNCTRLVSIELPDTLTSIGEASFYACTALESLELPDAVTKIGNYAFRKCAALAIISFGSGLNDIGESSFYGCESLVLLYLPENLTTIQAYAFKGCIELSEVFLPESLLTLGESAFYGCTELTQITIPASVTSVGSYCFSRSTGLKQICFLGDAPSIGDSAFSKVTATAYYPGSNATWTSAVRQNYGGTITWKAQ